MVFFDFDNGLVPEVRRHRFQLKPDWSLTQSFLLCPVQGRDCMSFGLLRRTHSQDETD